ncbi:MAG: hypothetical protein PHV13_02995 [Candidatus ainarchaeum sp.]|nr:hypothetical protein [Candidatus ainarchaeum sp.]
MGRPANGQEKVKGNVWVSKATRDYCGSDISLILEQAVAVKRGHALSLEETKLKVQGNLDNMQRYLLLANKKKLDDKDHTAVLEAVAKIRKLITGLEGNAITRID